jgi:hypothetical protein
MLKKKILDNIQSVLDEWLLGFNNDDFMVSIFSSEKINLKNAIINPDRVNKELKEKNIPFRLKAGLIGRISVKVSIINVCLIIYFIYRLLF